MQHLGVNFGSILRFELGFFIWVVWVFCLRNVGWFLKVATLRPSIHLYGTVLNTVASTLMKFQCEN